RGLIETAGTVGQRFGASKRFGVLLGGSYDWNGRGIDDIEPVPDLATLSGGTQARYFEAVDVREYRYYRSRWGLAGSLDFKPSDGSTIYVRDRKSTRLNSSHLGISYAVFCLKKKNKK